MHVIGLTGSIAMGKSYTARRIIEFGIPVWDADACVHSLMAPGGGAFSDIACQFPDAITPTGLIDRATLGQTIFADHDAKKRLEQIIHPKVQAEELKFLHHCARLHQHIAVLDIPLLFETSSEHKFDAVVVVQSHPNLQRWRALKRTGMTSERFDAIRAVQMSEPDKLQRADFVIHSGFDSGATAHQVASILEQIRMKPANVWPEQWH